MEIQRTKTVNILNDMNTINLQGWEDGGKEQRVAGGETRYLTY